MKQILSFIFCLLSLLSIAQNSSILFNGTSQYVEIPDNNNLDLSANFTLEGWIYPTGAGSQPTEGGMIINKESSYEIARFADGTFRYALSANGNGTDWSWYNTTLKAPLNTWTHFALVKSGSTVTFYVNTSSSNVNASNPASLAANTQTLRIGNRSSGPHFFNGYVDEIKIWNTAQTQQAIKNYAYNKFLSTTAAGLVAYYRMNEGTGAATINSSLNTTGINGTLINTPVWSTSPVQFSGNALVFDGTDDEVSIPHSSSINISSAITLEAWVYATKNTGIQNVICKSTLATNTGYIFPRTDDGWNNAVIYLFIGAGWQNVSAPYPSLNAWHHLAATYDGATIKLYIDGVLSASRAQTGTITTNTNALTLGNQPGFSEQFGGRVDEARVWNVARTQSQIQNNMMIELDPATQTGLVSYYTFNQGVAAGSNTGIATLIDHIGNNNGTITNFSLSASASNFIVQNNSITILPVVWNSFTGTVDNGDVLLKWSTSSEQNTKAFTVQHSTDGHEWSNIGNVAAAGNSNSILQYQFLHVYPSRGIHYYRVQQSDLDDKISISKIISVTIAGTGAHLRVFPNPVTGRILNVNLSSADRVSVYNLQGELLLQKKLKAGTQMLELPVLVKGIYQIKAGGEIIKLVVQ
jgi:hypothetical protein